MTYNDKAITFSGDLASYDYDAILRDKQRNITRLYELADYFVNADPIFKGIIKGVYTPFALHTPYRLVGTNEKTKAKYAEYYDRIHLHDRMRSIFYQYFKYGNVYVYMMEDGHLISLPVHLVRISNVMVGGEPVIEFNCKSVRDDMKQQGIKAQKDFLEDEDLTVRLDGFPPEVASAIQQGADWVQLNPDNTFVLQDLKEDWSRYAVPMVATCLGALARKALISKYEASLLNLGIRSFVHVTYGDTKNDILPDIVQLNQVNALFRKAMTGGALATTNQLCKAEVIQPDTLQMFDDDKYREVNAEILAAGGISGIIVSGRAEDGSNFASAQVSMQTAAMRIQQALDNFAELMNKVNARLNGGRRGMTHSSRPMCQGLCTRLWTWLAARSLWRRAISCGNPAWCPPRRCCKRMGTTWSRSLNGRSMRNKRVCRIRLRRRMGSRMRRMWETKKAPVARSLMTMNAIAINQTA